MSARTRSRDLREIVHGSHGSDEITIAERDILVGMTEYCVDIDKGDPNRVIPNPFHLTKNRYNRLSFTGSKPGRFASSWPAQDLPALPLMEEPSAYDYLVWRTELMNHANLADSQFNIPQAVGETLDFLKIIPNFLKKAAGGIPPARPTKKPLSELTPGEIGNAVGAANLTYWWGLKPLLSDLASIIQFMQAFERRMASLEKMREKGFKRVRKQLRVDVENSSRSGELVVSDLGLSSEIYANTEDSVARKVWATGTLYPGAFTPFHDTELLRKQLQRAMKGFTLQGVSQALWEVFPWSWLIDWFIGIGDYLSAINNALDLQLRHVSIMVHDISHTRVYAVPGEWSSWLKANLPYADNSRERKQRQVVPDWAPFVPSLQLPFIDERRLSILGSLSALQFGKR